MGTHTNSSQTLSNKCLLLPSSFLVFKVFSLGSPRVHSTMSWLSFIRHCQMVVFQEGYSNCLGNGDYNVLTSLLHSITRAITPCIQSSAFRPKFSTYCYELISKCSALLRNPFKGLSFYMSHRFTGESTVPAGTC